MTAEATIILCGGPINYSNLPVGTNASNAMISINGKPVIAWILDDLLSKGFSQATVVLRAGNQRLRRFLERAYTDRMEIKLAPLFQEGSIVQSLEAGLAQSTTSGLVRIVLGDTLILDPFEGESDFVYVGEVADAKRWCLVVLDNAGHVTGYIDKQEFGTGPFNALSGYYHLHDGEHLRKCVAESVANDEDELSHVLRRYSVLRPIRSQQIESWFDFGHIDNLVDARRRLLQPRYFNSLQVNPVLNTITKASSDNDKLRDELAWYLEIPNELKVLTPRIIDYRDVDGQLQIVQEHYGYPTLGELYLYGELSPDTWLSILRRLFRIHQEFRRHTRHPFKKDAELVYLNKTWDRLAQLRQNGPHWCELLEAEELTYNGSVLQTLSGLKNGICDRARALADSAISTVIHGDFCFSNILFDLNNQIVRLIDPRGSFGSKGIYGDPRYDIAKLRHSVIGLYDFLVADMFQITKTPGEFKGCIYSDGTPNLVGPAFDRMVTEAGYDLDEIKFIEGLQFISMAALHHDRPRAQRMMYLTGLEKLNEVLT